METLEISRDILINISPGTSAPGDYSPICIDSTGKAVFFKNKGVGTDAFQGIRAYSAKNELVQEMAQPHIYYSGEALARRNVHFSLDERGVCSHVMIAEWPDDQDDPIRLIGMDLNTGKAAYVSGGDFTMNYAGLSSPAEPVIHVHGMVPVSGRPYYCGHNYTYSFNGSTLSRSYSVPGFNGTPYAENIKNADRAFAM